MSHQYVIGFFSFLDLSEQQKAKDAPPATSGPRASDSGTESRHPPSSGADNGPKPPSGKPGWAEEGGSGWGGQGAPPNYQVHLAEHSKDVVLVRRSVLACRKLEKPSLNAGQSVICD